MAALVESPDQSDRVEESLREAAHHGAVRKRQGYSGDMLVEDRRLLGKAIYDLVKANPSALDANRVVADLQRVNEILDLQLKVALVAHGQTEVAA